jgi:hypothetical protein
MTSAAAAVQNRFGDKLVHFLLQTLRIGETFSGLLLFLLFFCPYVKAAGFSFPGYKLPRHADIAGRTVGRVIRKTDITVIRYAAPLVYAIPILGLIVAYRAARDRSVAAWDLLAGLVVVSATAVLSGELSGISFARVGWAAYLSLVVAIMLWMAGCARVALYFAGPARFKRS